MAEEKTEKPTQKRLKDARKKGQVCRSTDLTQAFLFLTGTGVLAVGGTAYVSELKQLMADLFQPQLLTGQLANDELLRRTGYAWGRCLILLAPLLASLFVVSAGVSFLQVRALFAPEVLKPKLDKLNPLKGLQNIFFKAKTYLELIKNLVKFSVVLALVYGVVHDALREIVLTARADLNVTASVAATLMFRLLFRVGMVFLILGAADYLLQQKLHMKQLMMSKYEVQKEFKEEEGDPHVKHMRRELHHELLAQSMVENVPKAHAVVVNPTHLAVAIRYEEQAMNAPTVTAKGQFSMAERIKELARKHRVPIVRNVPLAQSLYAVEIGQEIPEGLYEAVAEVLNWVYQLARAEELS
jgi:flagellar biosynthetic protein FlhB